VQQHVLPACACVVWIVRWVLCSSLHPVCCFLMQLRPALQHLNICFTLQRVKNTRTCHSQILGCVVADKVCWPCACSAGTLFASTRHTVAFSPGNQGWVINEGDWPGQLLSFVLDSDGEHWRGIKVFSFASTCLARQLQPLAFSHQSSHQNHPGGCRRAERKFHKHVVPRQIALV
jgi:hypothetical protein